MSHSIAYIIDVAGDVDHKFKEDHQVYTLPCAINFTDGEYVAEVDINREELLEKMKTEVPTTSICSLDYLEEILDDIRKRGLKDVLLITMGDNFSSLHSVIQLYSESLEDLNLYCFNSQAISFSEGAYLIRAMDLEKQGYSFEEICQKLEEEKEEEIVWLKFYVRSLDYLIRGGRIKKASGFVTNILNVRPLITLEDGALIPYDKVRGDKKGYKHLKEKVEEELDPNKKYYFSLMYGEEEEDRIHLEEMFQEEMKMADYCQVVPLSPIVLVHSGPQVAAVAIYNLDEEKGLDL